MSASAKDALIIGAPGIAGQLTGAWLGTTRHTASLPTLADGEQSWDVVALTSSPPFDASNPAATKELLAVAYTLLRPGGWVIGQIEQAVTLRGLARGQCWRALFHASHFGRPRGCRERLLAAGFAEPAVWYVHPNIRAPMGLIPATPAGNLVFARAAWAGRGHHRWVGFLSRLVVAHSGLGGLQQEHLFFWAQRPC